MENNLLSHVRRRDQIEDIFRNKVPFCMNTHNKSDEEIIFLRECIFWEKKKEINEKMKIQDCLIE